MTTYKGLPAPLICDYLSHENSKHLYEDAEFQISKIEMVANTGTYIDCPFHRYRNGKDISQTQLEKFANLTGVIVRASYKDGIEIDIEYFKGINVANKAVLVQTDWSDHWQTDTYFENHPFLTESAA